MRDPLTLGAAEILALAPDEPERIFPGDNVGMTRMFRRLARKWHPDRSTDAKANDVMARLGELRETAEKRLASGNWTEPDTLTLKTTDSRTFRFRYLAKAPFELGMMYIGKENIAWCLRPDYADLADNASRLIKSFPYANANMEKEVSRYLPSLRAELKTPDGSALIMPRDPELVRLSDLLDYAGGRIDSKQVAWIISSLLNTACYLRFAGLTHNDISTETFFVSPRLHYGALLGGWWYGAKAGQPLSALPTRSADLAPREVLDGKKGNPRLDQLLIRAIGRELLGDPTGSKLPTLKDVPKPLADWLRLPGPPDPVEDYRNWMDHVLPGSFGPRRFVKWDISPTSIYRPRS
jgi:hypothetical protein